MRPLLAESEDTAHCVSRRVSYDAASELAGFRLIYYIGRGGKPLGHNWATSARESWLKWAISSQPKAFRINTGHPYDIPGSHEVEGSNPSRSTNIIHPVNDLNDS